MKRLVEAQMLRRLLTGICFASCIFAGCALPEGGGNSVAVQGAITDTTGGSVSNGTESNTGGNSTAATTSSSSSLGGSAGFGGASSNTDPCIVDAGESDAGLCNCTGPTTTHWQASTRLQGGSDTAPPLDADPFNDCAVPPGNGPLAFLLPISPNTVVGYPYWTFEEGDVVYSIGALTSLMNNAAPVDFQMALYSDANGVPDANIYTSRILKVTDTTAGETPPEDVLPCPIRITKKGHYWLLMFSLNGKDNIRIYMHNQNVDQSISLTQGTVTPATPESAWTSTLNRWRSCGNPLGGNYPDFFVRYISAH